MFDVEARLKSILEGSTDVTYPVRDHDDEGGMDDQMIMIESALGILLVESEIFGEDELDESVFENATLAQLLREVTEEEIRADIEKKRSRWQKFKEAFKRFLESPFDPYGGLKELKAVNELVKDNTGDTIYTALPFFLGVPFIIMNRARKYKNFPENLARQYIDEAKKHEKHLEKIASNLEQEPDKKYKKAAKRVRKQIKVLNDMIREFERRAIDKAIL